MDIYNIEIFDSHNTSINCQMYCKNEREATAKAKRLSLTNEYKVIAHNDSNTAFEQYEQGELTEWTYPNGLGQIKANS